MKSKNIISLILILGATSIFLLVSCGAQSEKSTVTKKETVQMESNSQTQPVQTVQKERTYKTAAPVQQDQQAIIVYVTKTGTKYHRIGCSYLSRSCIPITLSNAIVRGYTPCSKCNPPR